MDTIWDQARAAISLIANGDAHSALTIYDALHRGEQAERKLALITQDIARSSRSKAITRLADAAALTACYDDARAEADRLRAELVSVRRARAEYDASVAAGED